MNILLCEGINIYMPWQLERSTWIIACENIRFSSLWFASSVWNFCRWVADVPPRETSPATKSEEKRMFSQATWIIIL